jgi:uncharacterized membrane protein (DUF2068 family)
MINIQRTRPLGITVIAIIVAIYGILAVLGGITLLGVSATAGVFTLILAVMELVLAWGLWNLRSWAFWATVVVEVLSLVNSIYALALGNSFDAFISILIALAVLIYLFADPNVRAAFRT